MIIRKRKDISNRIHSAGFLFYCINWHVCIYIYTYIQKIKNSLNIVQVSNCVNCYSLFASNFWGRNPSLSKTFKCFFIIFLLILIKTECSPLKITIQTVYKNSKFGNFYNSNDNCCTKKICFFFVIINLFLSINKFMFSF